MIVEIQAQRDYPAKRGTRAVKKGETLYAIKREGHYFIWAYLDKSYAEIIDRRLNPRAILPPIFREAEWQANFRKDLRELKVTGRASD